MGRKPALAQKMIGELAPNLVDLTGSMLFDGVRGDQKLSKRDQSLVMVVAMLTMNCPEQLRIHLDMAMDNGLKQNELIEVITHLAYYSGWPDVMTAGNDGEGAIFKKGYCYLIENACVGG